MGTRETLHWMTSNCMLSRVRMVTLMIFYFFIKFVCVCVCFLFLDNFFIPQDFEFDTSFLKS